MAKFRRCKLSWKPSESDQVIGYRLYWSKGHTLGYDSNYFELGYVTEVYLPDVLKLDPRYGARILLGITAVDINGNESDMVRVATPYQMAAPPAPADLLMTALDGFSVVEPTGKAARKIDIQYKEETAQHSPAYSTLKRKSP